MDAVEEAGKLGINKTHAVSYKNDSKGVRLNYQVTEKMLSCMRSAECDAAEMSRKVPEFLKPIKAHLEDE